MTFPGTLPTPRTLSPMDAPPLRWGIIGTGWIAARFSDALHRSTQQRVVAVGSRSIDTAAAFAAEHGIDRGHGSYDALVGDPGVDIVYVATPHPQHLECAMLALRAGKHVLVEKPFALSAAQGEQIADLARAQNLFCAEALWTMFLPKFDVIRQLLDGGVLGDISSVLAEYGERFDPPHRIFRADLAGGPLLDLGTYPIGLCTWIFGEPASVLANAQPHPAGVHGQLTASLIDPDGRQGVVHTTVNSFTPATAIIGGSAATITLPNTAYQPGDIVLTAADGQRSLTWSEDHVGHAALYFQAAEVARCIAEGRTESPLRPVADSLTLLRTLDRVREQAGIIFPGEQGY